MRKIIVDTDTASDDAAALIIAANDRNIELLGVTVVAGNVGLEQATANAIQTLEICSCSVPVFKGAPRPLLKERKETISVHGRDGMGDTGIINPEGCASDIRAVDFIIDSVKKYPGEVEIIALGPVTNVALAIMLAPEIMKNVKMIWSMGTPGFGEGNASPVAEFNVFIDPDAYEIMLRSGIPVTIAGFDLCVAENYLTKDLLAEYARGNRMGKFLERATAGMLKFTFETKGRYTVDLPDALATAAALWDGYALEYTDTYGVCITSEGPAYGQVIFYKKGNTYEAMPKIPDYPHRVITKTDNELFISRLSAMLTE